MRVLPRGSQARRPERRRSLAPRGHRSRLPLLRPPPHRPGRHAVPAGHHRGRLDLRGRTGGPSSRSHPSAIERLTAEAMHDIAHYLRPAHLAQLRRIIDDPEASGNDRFVATDLLKNVNISAGGVLPMCQDTGTAIVMGKKSEGVLTGADDGEAISRGVYDAYTRLNLRYSQLAPLTTYDEKNTGHEPARPDRDLLHPRDAGSGRDLTAGVQVPLHGQGRRLGQQVVPVPGDQGDPEPDADAGVPRREDPLARHRRLPAVPPGRGDRRHVGGVRAQDREVRLRALPRQPARPSGSPPRTASGTSSSRSRSSS